MASVLEVVTISVLKVVVLDTVDAGKGWTNISTWEVTFSQTSSEEIDVLDNSVELAQLIQGELWDKQRQILPAADLDVETVLNIVHVTRNTVITTTLDVGCSQISTRDLLV